jgi:hypothetical protein
VSARRLELQIAGDDTSKALAEMVCSDDVTRASPR